MMTFLFNGDQGIQVNYPNIDGALRSAPGGAVCGEYAQKCVQVAPRAVHLPDQTGAVVLYERPTEEYVAYVTDLYGGCPQIIAPCEIDMSVSLELTEDLLRCERSLAELRQLAKTGSHVLDPFIAEPRIFDLAHEIGMPVTGIREDRVREGLVTRLNDKAVFQHVCKELGIPIPDSKHVLGWDNVALEAKRIFERDGGVVIRRTRAAGGLGVVMVKQKDLGKPIFKKVDGVETCVGQKPTEIVAYLESEVSPLEAWDSEIILVEPLLDIDATPSTLLHVDSGDFTIRAMSEQVVNGGSFYGSIFPSRQPPEIARTMAAYSAKYAAWFIRQGGANWFNLDWGVQPDGTIVAFESNARYTGSIHPKVIAKRLRGDDEIGHVWSNDAFEVPVGTSFGEVRDKVAELAWDPTRKRGVVITIPPAGDDEKFVLGFVAMADNSDELHELHADVTDRLGV